MIEEPKSFPAKVGGLLGSLRFWTATLAAASLALAHPDRVFDIVAGWLGTVTGIGTADSIAKKISAQKPTR